MLECNTTSSVADRCHDYCHAATIIVTFATAVILCFDASVEDVDSDDSADTYHIADTNDIAGSVDSDDIVAAC